MSYDIVDNANGFRLTALRCMEQCSNNDGSMQFLPLQGIAIAALASELYLKGILISEGKSKEEVRKLKHNLKDLYSETSSELKGKLADSVDLQNLISCIYFGLMIQMKFQI